MSAIDEIVSRSRRGGSFSQRRTFTLARKRAIRKMREFALADPYFFVLELIQAAIAQDATYISINTDDDTFTLSYTNGFFAEPELAQLFDFLFAGKDRTDIGHVRELALGINALLLFNPDQIVVESGDGTMRGSTRLVLHRSAEHVEVGKPRAPIRGTFIRVDRLRRWKLRHKTALEPLPGGLPLEVAAIEERCLTAPIPVIVNGQPLFGYGTRRIPRLLGYQRVIELDEGDLFGTLGFHPQGFQASFKLLTYGVWIQSFVYEGLPGGTYVGGVVCFDRLHKTADHSGIVQDGAWSQLWDRLAPYARELTRGATGKIEGNITLLSGATLSARDLRPMLRACDRVVLVPPDVDPGARQGQLAADIGRALEALVVRAAPQDEDWLRGLAGPDVSLLRIDLSGDADHAFFTQQSAHEPPARPWLAPEVALATVPLYKLVQDIARLQQLMAKPSDSLAADESETEPETEPDDERMVANLLGHEGAVSATVYTPVDPPSETRLTVEVITCERLAWQGQLASPYPGHVLRVEVPDLSPRILRQPLGGDPDAPPLAQFIAWAMAHQASAGLEAAAHRALSRAGTVGEAGAARAIALAALSRSLVSRIQTGASGLPEVSFFTMTGTADPELLDRPLLPTLGGGWVSIRQAAELINDSGGLLYGVLPSIPPALEGLDQQRILQLHEDEERMLLTLVGDSTYVRVDQRDVLAEDRGVQCRDLALGLRQYPDFPLLVEGVDPSGWPAADQEACLERLVIQLARCYAGVEPPRPSDPAALPGWEENRRHACRHLQWFACGHAYRKRPGAPHFGVVDLPLFLDPEGRAWSFQQVARALASPQGLTLQLRPAFGGSELGALAEVVLQTKDPDPERAEAFPRALAASPMVSRLLATLGRVRCAMDFELPHEVATDPEAATQLPFLLRSELKGDGFAGVVGLPESPEVSPQVAVLEPISGRLHEHRSLACAYSMVGLIRLTEGTLDEVRAETIKQALRKAGESLITRLLGLLPDQAPGSDRYHAAVRHLLAFTADRLHLVAAPDGHVDSSVPHPLAARILALPLFPLADGRMIAGWRLVEMFCAFGRVPVAPAGGGRDQGASAKGEVAISADAPAYIADWIARHLSEARVLRLASGRAGPVPPGHQLADRPGDEHLAHTVQHWLETLRPDDWTDPATQQRLPFRIFFRSRSVFANFTDPLELIAYSYFDHVPNVLVNADHWLVRYARQHLDQDPLALMALLCACYAHINAALEPVTNVHERIFQLRLIEALERGELRALDPPTPRES